VNNKSAKVANIDLDPLVKIEEGGLDLFYFYFYFYFSIFYF